MGNVYEIEDVTRDLGIVKISPSDSIILPFIWRARHKRQVLPLPPVTAMTEVGYKAEPVWLQMSVRNVLAPGNYRLIESARSGNIEHGCQHLEYYRELPFIQLRGLMFYNAKCIGLAHQLRQGLLPDQPDDPGTVRLLVTKNICPAFGWLQMFGVWADSRQAAENFLKWTEDK